MSNNKNINKKLLPLLFVGVLMGALDISIVGPAIPSIEKTIQVDQRLLGWIFAIYVLFNLVGISLFAKLSDLFGRKSIYIVSVSIFALGSLAVSFSRDFTELLIGRAIQGFGASGIFPVASAVVGDVYPAEKRGQILGLIGAVFGIAFILGPIIAGTMLSFFHWNALFLINIPIAIVIIIGSVKILPNHKIKNQSQFDWKGILLLGLLLGSFAYGINQIDAHQFYSSLLSINVYPFLIISILLLLLFLRVEQKASVPVVKTTMFFNRQIRLVGLIALGTGLLQASFIFIPDFAVEAFNVNPAKASFMLIPVVTATAIGSPLFGRMIDKTGSRIVIFIGLLLTCCGFFILQLNTHQLFLFYTAGALIGFGLSILAGSALRYIMLNEVSSEERASTQGLITIFISIGQLLGGALIGVITVSEKGILGYIDTFLYLSIVIFILALFSLRLKSHKQEIETINQ